MSATNGAGATARTAVEGAGLWEEELSSGSRMLDAADHILRSSWLIDLPVVPSVDEDDDAAEVTFAEVKVIALHWGGGPTTGADQM
eukprot:5441739-Amphidinium_carterae.1